MHGDADALSRIPVRSVSDEAGDGVGGDGDDDGGELSGGNGADGGEVMVMMVVRKVKVTGIVGPVVVTQEMTFQWPYYS